MATSLLLADDSPTIAKILGMALQSEDYEIRAALTAEDAIKELQANPPYFFLVDLTMPGKNGYEFARMIRADRKLKDTRILLLASAFDPADENEVKACGADGVITKPFDPGELRRRLREVRDAPRSFGGMPDVTGSLSGAPIVTGTAQADAPPSAPPSAPPRAAADTPPAAPSPAALAASPAEPEMDLNALLADQGEEDPLSILAGSGGADANALLGEALNEDTSLPSHSEPTPVFDLTDGTGGEFTNATVLLDASAMESMGENTPSQPVVDLSNSFATPPRGTALLDLNGSDLPPAAPKAAGSPAGQQTAPASAPKAPAEEPLSANAQALAAFFSAEIDANAEPPAAPPAAPSTPEEDAFDASLSSIEWGSPKANLNEWSSAPPPGAAKPSPAAAAPAPAAPARASAAPAPSPAPKSAPKREVTHEISMEGFSSIDPSTFAAPDMAPVRPNPAQAQAPRPASPTFGASSEGGSFMFDTGGSNFRFADDYVKRITKAFTGNVDEMTLGKDVSAPVFHKSSDDRQGFSPAPAEEESPAYEAPAAAPVMDPLAAKAKHMPTGGGAWSPEEVKRIEQIVRDEVQMVVREIAEKIVWEVVPELAENLIKKELEKVLKEME